MLSPIKTIILRDGRPGRKPPLGEDCRRPRRLAQEQGAFTLIETLVAMTVLAVVCASVYSAIAMAFRSVQTTRENLRATQILSQTMEVIRLCNWDQTNPGTNFIPTALTVPYYTDNTSVTNGPFYRVSVSVTNPPSLGATYSNDLRLVQIRATWNSGRIQHTRTMSTFVSLWGLQNYVW